jgi:radical SAM-linked protein
MVIMQTNHEPPTLRVRIKFKKTEAMRFTSHLDLYRTWERTIRRAELPLSYSHGFNPRPRINLAAALPLGYTSTCELIDIWFDMLLSLEDVFDRIKSSQPPGIEVATIDQIDLQSPKLQTMVQASEYSVIILELYADLNIRLERLIKATTLPRTRRGKDYDLRPLITIAQSLPNTKDGYQQFRLQLSTRENATGRPDEVLSALEIPIEKTLIERTAILINQV